MDLSQYAREFEPVTGARARDEHLWMQRMKIHDEVVIRSIGEETDTRLTHRRLSESGKNRSQCVAKRVDFGIVHYTPDFARRFCQLPRMHDGGFHSTWETGKS